MSDIIWKLEDLIFSYLFIRFIYFSLHNLSLLASPFMENSKEITSEPEVFQDISTVPKTSVVLCPSFLNLPLCVVTISAVEDNQFPN